ncbi:MAG: GNAT family protein [Salinisphaera sp.]|jgi:RimJ/RimL family protein N-acetyltransferase|nr:GNAT family protein [Salinisphaera sp.]
MATQIDDHDQNAPLGVAGYMRIQPANGSIEIGHIHYADVLKQTRAATEAIALMMQHAFDLGYRRVEWKCDALNAASRQAALRLGFVFEGIFRQATVYKRRNRDTAWYSVIDSEWPELEACFQAWLGPDNFDANGRRRQKLSALTQSLTTQTGGSE